MLAVEIHDGGLVARLVAGDDDALRDLFDRHGGFVLGIARRVTGSAALAEEVLQDVVTALWRHPERYDAERGSLRAYLGVQTHRRAVDLVRSESRRRSREERSVALREPLCVEQPAGQAPAGALGEESDVTAAVREAIARLPEDQRAAVELAFWQGRTYREVAVVLGIPEGTAKSRLRLAQRKLHQWLSPAVAGSA